LFKALIDRRSAISVILLTFNPESLACWYIFLFILIVTFTLFTLFLCVDMCISLQINEV